ncbi:MAG: HIT family protein [Acidimicrobiales bacterium]
MPLGGRVMGLEQIWAGWRREYVSSVSVAGQEGDSDGEGCVFCSIANGVDDEALGVLWRGRYCIAILNAFPYASGHLMVMPKRHVSGLELMTPGESVELWKGLLASLDALRRAYRPDGVNIGANLGRAAGAGLPEHVHVHALPRWAGDTNFMTTVAGVRVMPEALSDSWKRLRDAWRSEDTEAQD